MTRRANTFGKRGGGGRRELERVAAEWPALLVSLSERHPAILLEISTTGARVQVANPPKKFSEVFLVVDHINAYSRIVWRRGEICGLRFESEIDSFDVEQLRRRTSDPQEARLTPLEKGGADDWRSGLAR